MFAKYGSSEVILKYSGQLMDAVIQTCLLFGQQALFSYMRHTVEQMV
jgi:hypothetical protein